MIATKEEARDAMVNHHRILTEEVASRAETILSEPEDKQSHTSKVSNFIEYMDREVLTHARAEEGSVYIAAREIGLANLVEEMEKEHTILTGKLSDLQNSASVTDINDQVSQISSLFAEHVGKENELILPRLLSSNTVDIRFVLGEMHQLFEAGKSTLEEKQTDQDLVEKIFSLLLESGKQLSKAGLSEQGGRLVALAWAETEYERPELATKATRVLHNILLSQNSERVSLTKAPNLNADFELDVRTLAPAQRHSQIFSAYRDLPDGKGFLLINDHDPKPLQYQFEAEYSGSFTWDYLEAGPKVWRVRIGRP